MPTPNEKKTGFLASLRGDKEQIAELENQLSAERLAHAETRRQLAEHHGAIRVCEELAARIDARPAAAAVKPAPAVAPAAVLFGRERAAAAINRSLPRARR